MVRILNHVPRSCGTPGGPDQVLPAKAWTGKCGKCNEQEPHQHYQIRLDVTVKLKDDDALVAQGIKQYEVDLADYTANGDEYDVVSALIDFIAWSEDEKALYEVQTCEAGPDGPPTEPRKGKG